jgi:trans-aconitate 2-methyltransferase
LSWNPDQYLQYADARQRPAVELLARVGVGAPRVAVDLGCGTGNTSRLLAARWPGARVIGADRDSAMLAKARSTEGGGAIEWVQCDLGAWQPEVPPDLIFSNAALHWLDNHATLFPRLLSQVGTEGCLAVQMPDNFKAASHQVLFDLAESARWRDVVGKHVRRAPVATADCYFDWLSPGARQIDIWATEYLQALPPRADGEHPVVAWMRGSALTPFLEGMAAKDQDLFLGEFREGIAGAYPPRGDGGVLFPFRRIFIVAER